MCGVLLHVHCCLNVLLYSPLCLYLNKFVCCVVACVLLSKCSMLFAFVSLFEQLCVLRDCMCIAVWIQYCICVCAYCLIIVCVVLLHVYVCLIAIWCLHVWLSVDKCVWCVIACAFVFECDIVFACVCVFWYVCVMYYCMCMSVWM